MPSNIINPNSDPVPKIHAFGQEIPLGLVLPTTLQILIREEGERAADEDEGVEAHAEACGIGGGFGRGGGGCRGGLGVGGGVACLDI